MGHLAVIPARSGSKGLKDKNIKMLRGKPLLAYTVEAARQTGLFDCVHVSTDSAAYAQIAEDYGAEAPFLRGSELSSDTATTWDAMRYVIGAYGKRGKEFDTVTVLQPTSPLRSAEDIQGAFCLFGQNKADSVISVCEAEHSPLWMNTLPQNQCLEGFIREEANGPRQRLGTYYRINGAIYIVKTEVLMEHGSLYGKRGYAYVMPKERSVDIDDAMDFAMAEFWMSRAGQ